jgi:protein gp37
MAKRLQAMGQPNYRDGFKVTMHEDVLKAPFGWRRPSMVFVNSMSDLFHKDVPASFIQKAFEVMRSLPQHHFQILTKRAERLAELSRSLPWARNIWMGVSVENKDYIQRIGILRQTDACVKFLSIEPLLGPISGLDLTGIDWVIVGGESGPKARPMKEEWATSIRDQCLDAGVAFFFKQWGGTNKKRSGRTLEGRIWDEMPRAAA